MSKDRPGPLNDVRIIELADEKCQLTAKLLADMGADCIKVEKPGGDDVRKIGPFVDDVPHPERSLYFWYYNTNKRSITLNLETHQGQDILKQLVGMVDVLIESFQPGYLSSLGLGYEELSQIKPDLIMTSITGWGQTGPYKDWKTSDMVALAMGGLMHSSGYDDFPGTPESQWRGYDGKDEPGKRTPPMRPQGLQGFNTGNHFATMGILSALYHKDLTGEGQYLDCSIAESVNSATEAAMPTYIFRDLIVHRQTMRHQTATSGTAPWHYQANDGVYIMTFGSARSLSQWLALLRWMDSKGMAEDLHDEKYRQMAIRGPRSGPDYEHVMELIGKFINSMPSWEAYRGGQMCSLPWGLVRSPDEALDDPHLWDRGAFEEWKQPGVDKTGIMFGRPSVFSESPWSLRRYPPSVGEHNEEVYLRELGFTKKQFTALREANII